MGSVCTCSHSHTNAVCLQRKIKLTGNSKLSGRQNLMSARGLLLQWLRVWPLLKWKRASFCKWFWRSLLSINLFKIIAINFVVLHLGVFVLYRVLRVAFAGEVLQAALTYKALNILSSDLSVSCLYHQVIPFSMLFRTWKLLKKYCLIMYLTWYFLDTQLRCLLKVYFQSCTYVHQNHSLFNAVREAFCYLEAWILGKFTSICA